MGKNKKFGYWRDTHLKLIGDAVKDLNIRFILDWRYTTKEDLDLNKYFENKIIIMFSKATIKERRQYYREEWDPKDLPEFISKDIKKREGPKHL